MLCKELILGNFSCVMRETVNLLSSVASKTLFFELYGSEKGWLRVFRPFEEVFCQNSQLHTFHFYFEKSLNFASYCSQTYFIEYGGMSHLYLVFMPAVSVVAPSFF